MAGRGRPNCVPTVALKTMMITVPAPEENVAIELRDFKIQSGQMAAFIEAWRTGVVPLRKSHGFRIAGAWTVAGEDRFVWILEAEGTRAEFEARDARYYESQERVALVSDPRQWIEAHSSVFLDAVAVD